MKDRKPSGTGCTLSAKDPEILAIRDRHLARVGGTGSAALRRFHDRLAGSGRLQPALAERALVTEP